MRTATLAAILLVTAKAAANVSLSMDLHRGVAPRTESSPRDSLPGILLLQGTPKTKPSIPMNISIANYLAQELDNSGKAKPVVYSVTDPVFRSAVNDGTLVNVPDWPTLEQATQIAGKLHLRYVLTYRIAESRGKGKRPQSSAQLFEDGRQVWTDDLDLSVKEGLEGDSRDTQQSLARTWAVHMVEGPLKPVKTEVRLETPAPQPGQQPPVVKAPSTTESAADHSSDLKSQVERLIADHEVDRAIYLIRDAVDAHPYDADLRVLLVQTLLDANRFSEAAEEANHGIEIAPKGEELRTLAARALIAAGDKADARTVLNEAVARNPSGPQTRSMLAEVNLARLEPGKALEHLDASIKESPTRGALFLRSLSHALLGDSDSSAADLKAMQRLPDDQSEAEKHRLFELATSALNESLLRLGTDTRLLMQKAAVNSDDVALRAQADDELRTVRARVGFLSAAPVPADYVKSNDRLLLAHKLFVQTLLGIQGFLTGAGEDSMTDAHMDLGEALRQAALARTAFADEQKRH